MSCLLILVSCRLTLDVGIPSVIGFVRNKIDSILSSSVKMSDQSFCNLIYKRFTR